MYRGVELKDQYYARDGQYFTKEDMIIYTYDKVKNDTLYSTYEIGFKKIDGLYKMVSFKETEA